MTKVVQEQFEEDLQQCLRVAGKLAEDETAETKQFVAKQLEVIQTFLQNKQNQIEDQIKQQIKDEQDEIKDLRERIDKLSSGDEVDANIGPKTLSDMWLDIKQTVWIELHNCLIEKTKDNVTIILDKLIMYMQKAFKVTEAKAIAAREDIMFQVLYPGEDRKPKGGRTPNKDMKLPLQSEKKYKDLDELCRHCQIKSTPFCLPVIQEAIRVDVMKHVKGFDKMTKEMETAHNKYIDKCIEFSWSAVFMEPLVQLVTDPRKDCKSIANSFDGLQTVVNHQQHVEWPAIVQGRLIKEPWILCDPKRNRQVIESEKRAPLDSNPRAVEGERKAGNETQKNVDAGLSNQKQANGDATSGEKVNSEPPDQTAQLSKTQTVQQSEQTSIPPGQTDSDGKPQRFSLPKQVKKPDKKADENSGKPSGNGTRPNVNRDRVFTEPTSKGKQAKESHKNVQSY